MAGTERKERQGFSEGDLVVYPSHGAGYVVGIEERTVLGEARRYYVVHIPDDGLTLSIPADGETGLRYCCGEEDVTAALETLGGEAVDMPGNWSQRLKHNQEKIRNGEITEVAEVVRNLSAYSSEHGLSTGERGLLAKARQILVSEIALVRGVDAEDAASLVDGALRDGGNGAG